MKIYLAGKMRGIPQFNFPAFTKYAAILRSHGHEVFNPAEHDIARHGAGINDSQTGNLNEAIAKGFSIREALGDDLAWICAEADAIAMIPGWESSLGANAELATARALGLDEIFFTKEEINAD